MIIFELHTLQAAYILTKKETCWNCCNESLIFYFYKSLKNILRSFYLSNCQEPISRHSY